MHKELDLCNVQTYAWKCKLRNIIYLIRWFKYFHVVGVKSFFCDRGKWVKFVYISLDQIVL